MTAIRCPICNSVETTFFGLRTAFAYYRCHLCLHLFLSPFPSDRKLNKLYSGDYEFKVDETSLRRFKLVARNVIGEFMQMNPSGKTLLDIGAGYGTFVEVAISDGLDAVGIEPAKNLYKIANSRLKGKIFHHDLDAFIKTNNETYDFISLIHVIEHVKQPERFLKTVLTLLKPNGVLYIETPNSYSHLANVEKENYTFLTPPDHINLFSKLSLGLLIDACVKSKTRIWKTYSYPEHIVGILRTIKNKRRDNHLSRNGKSGSRYRGFREKGKRMPPFFDRAVAPLLTPLLNLGNRGSFLQVFIQKKI